MEAHETERLFIEHTTLLRSCLSLRGQVMRQRENLSTGENNNNNFESVGADER
jgi:hypothetical protein